MTSFTTDQWAILALVFVLGLLVGGFLFSGGGRKWRHRYNAEVERRKEIEANYTAAEKDWRERDSLRAAALKSAGRDRDNDGVDDRLEAGRVTTTRVASTTAPVIDRDGDGIDDRRER